MIILTVILYKLELFLVEVNDDGGGGGGGSNIVVVVMKMLDDYGLTKLCFKQYVIFAENIFLGKSPY